MTDPTHTGRCYCGEVAYRFTGGMDNLCYCHCQSCRRVAGSPFVAWGTVRLANFELTEGNAAVLRSSKPVERQFCPTCGTPLTYQHEKRAGDIDVTLASLDDPTIFQPKSHIWVQDKLPWLTLGDGLPQFETYSTN